VVLSVASKGDLLEFAVRDTILTESGAGRASQTFPSRMFKWRDIVTFARRQFLHLAAGAAALSAASRVWARTYPARPIRLLIPVAPGGTLDIVARSWADKTRIFLGTGVIENHPGGGGSLGAAAVAHARPDGYTILWGARRSV
jgi:hypothetical protein